jgi:hypothetical protein
MDEFQRKARAAAASFSSMNPAEALGQSLMNDNPKIDSALKQFVSIIAARGWTAPAPGDDRNAPNEQARAGFVAMRCAGTLSKKINSYRIPTRSDDDNGNDSNEEKDESKVLELEVVRIVWNGLADKGKKPSMFLGKQSLRHVYPSILAELNANANANANAPKNVDPEQFLAFLDEFGRLLDRATNRKLVEENKALQEEDDDSRLLWDADSGQAELSRRRERRKKNAESANTTQIDGNNESESLTIEELPEE